MVVPALKFSRAVKRPQAIALLISLVAHVLLFGAYWLRPPEGRVISQGADDPAAFEIVLTPAARTEAVEDHAAAPPRHQTPPPPLNQETLAQASPTTPEEGRETAPSPEAPAVAAPKPADGDAPGLTRVAVDPALGDDYRHRLLRHIEAYRQRLSVAPGRPSSGTVLVRFWVDRDGRVLAASVVGGSGVADFDDEAVATIWRARPMPAIPAALPERLSVTLPIAFGPRPGSAPG